MEGGRGRRRGGGEKGGEGDWEGREERSGRRNPRQRTRRLLYIYSIALHFENALSFAQVLKKNSLVRIRE